MWVWIAGNFCDLASEGQQNGPEWTTSPFSETHFVRWENMFQFSSSKALQRKADKILTAVIPIWPQPKVKQDLVWPSLPSWIYHRNTRTIKLQYFTESFRSFDAGLGNSDRTRNRNRNRNRCIIGDKRTNECDRCHFFRFLRPPRRLRMSRTLVVLELRWKWNLRNLMVLGSCGSMVSSCPWVPWFDSCFLQCISWEPAVLISLVLVNT